MANAVEKEREKEKRDQMYQLMMDYVVYLGEMDTVSLLNLFENNGETASVFSSSPKCKDFPLLCPGK